MNPTPSTYGPTIVNYTIFTLPMTSNKLFWHHPMRETGNFWQRNCPEKLLKIAELKANQQCHAECQSCTFFHTRKRFISLSSHSINAVIYNLPIYSSYMGLIYQCSHSFPHIKSRTFPGPPWEILHDLFGAQECFNIKEKEARGPKGWERG